MKKLIITAMVVDDGNGEMDEDDFLSPMHRHLGQFRPYGEHCEVAPEDRVVRVFDLNRSSASRLSDALGVGMDDRGPLITPEIRDLARDIYSVLYRLDVEEGTR